jgi:tRNA(His) 5'-end guanylyltransferase
MKDDFGMRMKSFEAPAQGVLQPRTPAIIRVDGKAFHTYTKEMDRPYDYYLHMSMRETMKLLCENIQNTVFAYTQSDEISILLNDWKKFNTSQWFDGKIQKIVSVAASMATGFFNEEMAQETNKMAFFDARVFNLPKEEVTNYFIWRCRDWHRNSVNMLARSYYSHKELHGLNSSQVQDKLFTEKGVNWADLDDWKKNGTAMYKLDGEWHFSDSFDAKFANPLFGELMKAEEE